MPRIFPNSNSENMVICVTGVGARSGFSALISDCVPSLDTLEKCQCFPLYIYNESSFSDSANEAQSKNLFDDHEQFGMNRRSAISDDAIKHFQHFYSNKKISAEDVFFYIYGLLHCPDFKDRFADNLNKELPRIPCVKRFEDFLFLSHAGRKLADLHLNFEEQEPYPIELSANVKELKAEDYRVSKMKYGKSVKDKDLSVLIYNEKITLSKIPVEAYLYEVNGKPALDWVVERQCWKQDKDSGIINDSNVWAIDSMGDAAYPLKLFQRVITVSLETMKIVNTLPKLDI